MPGVTAQELQAAQATSEASYAQAQRDGRARTELVRRAVSEGWTLQRIAMATGLTVGRLSQLTGRRAA